VVWLTRLAYYQEFRTGAVTSGGPCGQRHGRCSHSVRLLSYRSLLFARGSEMVGGLVVGLKQRNLDKSLIHKEA